MFREGDENANTVFLTVKVNHLEMIKNVQLWRICCVTLKNNHILNQANLSSWNAPKSALMLSYWHTFTMPTL